MINLLNEVRGLGWRMDLEDRAELYAGAVDVNTFMAESSAFNAPTEIDHRGWIKVEDQGRMGSCSGHAISTIQEVLWYIQTGGSVVQLSRMFGYLAGQKLCGLLGGDQGATITGSIRGARELGCCDERVFPYPSQYTSRIPNEALTAAREHLCARHAPLRSYDDCYRWLATGTGGIEIGVTWTSVMASNTSGVMELRDVQSGQRLGGHALAVVGYSTRKDARGRLYLWMVNSHSLQWGNKGWAEVSPDCFDWWGRQQNSELIGITDITADKTHGRNVPAYTKLIA